MKKLGALMYLALLASLTLAGAQNVVLIEEDFEDAGRTLNTGNNGAAVTEVADPAAGGTNGTVAAVDLSGANQWGAINASPSSNLALPIASVAGTDTFFGTIDVYIDSANTTYNTGENLDRFNLIFRFNRGTDDADRVTISSNHVWETLLLDEWNTITIPEQIIPATDNNGAPVTHVLPIISLRDQGTADGGVEALPGTAAYFDNFRIDVSVPADDPNLAATAISFGSVEQSTGPHTTPLQITNTGTANVLNITGASFSGADAGLFSLTDVSFPVMVDVGETADLMVTFSPGAATGDFMADLDLASDDEGDPMFSVNVSASVEEPFQGIEMIINGDFETGDLSAWRDDNRFDFTDVETHRGTGAAVFTLTGSQEWGEARVNRPGGQENETAVPITPEMIGKAYKYSAWYFRPSEGGPEPADTLQTIFRWNAKNPGSHSHGFSNIGSMPVDTWVRMTGEGTVPDVDHEGVPVDHLVPLWSFRDVARDDIGGRFMYIDDVSFKIEGTPPAPELEIIAIEVDEEAGVVRVTWNSTPGAIYGIERAADLDGWLEETDDFPASDGATTTYEDTTGLGLGEPRLFYRIRQFAE